MASVVRPACAGVLGFSTAEASAQGQDPAGDKPLRKGRSLVEPPAAKAADGHGAEKPTDDGHGAQEPAGKAPATNGNQSKKPGPQPAPHAAERDFDTAAARAYAAVRVDPGIKGADAVQLACAAAAQVDLFITNDERLSGRAVAGIQFIVSLARAPL